ncbi:MAG: hypothetical protein U0790_23730 [Isosphaeraceae bacterium]
MNACAAPQSSSAPVASSRPDLIPAPPARPAAARRPWNASSRRALAMLDRFPVAAAPLPRLHVERPGTAEGLRILDRPTGQRLTVYTPRFDSQFKAGHRSGRWYVRPVDDGGVEPRGPSFASAKAAVEAIAAGRWSFAALLAERHGLRLRVIWPRQAPQALR